ncbi:MAG: type II toxin-antitoxin system RelE/ParE family toxin [Syntrophobacteraceae bacterium]|nr:type II toxin-antitoxin system RelE/ParE family toxin [Syntrophobacteraceae bacterium]
MKSYKIEFSTSADKALAKLAAPVRQRIADRITKLAENPRPRGAKKLAGAAEYLRVREGDYRIIYQVKDAVLTILIVRMGHRREVYKL